jgi:signal transduction histidine kinase
MVAIHYVQLQLITRIAGITILYQYETIAKVLMRRRENIFAAFTRSSASGDVDGTGLGLAIVKEIAEKHDGDAWARSTLGEGATFYISIAKNLH